MDLIREHESEVRTYCRTFPRVFSRARGAVLEDDGGRRSIDFFAGAGALNYGHNPPALRRALIEYLERDGVTHSLDLATTAKIEFIREFTSTILEPRGLGYRLMFPGPTGTNAIEAALKIARKVTGRSAVVAFTRAFHGMTLGSLALTANAGKRAGAGVPLGHVHRFPYEGWLGAEIDTIEVLRRALEDPGSGFEEPAAIVLETVQAEGGVNVASRRWLARLAALARERGILLIADDIQVGCGRTGPFFSFEGIFEPDIVCLSKSLSGYGLPFSLVLLRPEHDLWEPGEHNGTFRGNNHAFVTARAALVEHWRDGALSERVATLAGELAGRLREIAEPLGGRVRGRGLIQGLELPGPGRAARVARAAFSHGLIIETCGPRDETLKLLPPLTIPAEELHEGLDLLAAAIDSVETAPVRAAAGAAGGVA